MIAIEDAVEHYLERRASGGPDGPGAGAYAGSILRRWAAWLERERGVRAVSDLEAAHLDGYVRALARRVDRGEYAPGTARTYYAVVRSFCSWGVDAGVLGSNPAAAVDADALLPAGDGAASRRSWSTDQRRALVAHAKRRALEAGGERRLAALREYALVALLVHADLRGSELCRVPDDERRSGAAWDDVDFYTGRIRVLGPSGRLEDAPLPAPARRPLRRYRVVLDPPTTDWPLFPTRHAPSIARRVRAVLEERGEDAEALLAGATAKELARERAIAPPAITTEGARAILRRLSEAAPVDVDDRHLTPRDARGGRGAGDRDPATARPALRRPRFERSLAPIEDVVPVDAKPPAKRRPDGDRAR